tara:strand:- start:748 stop:1602 length:855 start_codon:yes stop_codon:yes gene_type:complete
MGRVKGKGISKEKFNALGQKVRKFINSLKGMKFSAFRAEGRPSTEGSAARKRIKDANKGKDAVEKAPTTKDKITYASAAKKERQIIAELLSLKKNSELTSAQRKQLEVLQSRVDGVAAKAFDKANVRGAITKTKMKGYDPSKNVPKTKDQDMKAYEKQQLKEDRERVELVRKLAKEKGMAKAKGGMTMKKKGMAKGGAMMKKKGMAMGGLKKPAAGQTGLKKLPTSVRNKMGYAQKGGMMKKKGMARGGMKKKGYAAGGMTVKYKVGGMAKGKMYGSVDNRKKK